MLSVDFYLLDSINIKDNFLFSCKLANKLYAIAQTAYFYMPDMQAVELLDEMLWTWDTESFLPHEICKGDKSYLSPLLIGLDIFVKNQMNILVNLTQEIPCHHNQFKKIIEIVSAKEQDKAIARKRYAIYRKNNYNLKIYKECEFLYG